MLVSRIIAVLAGILVFAGCSDSNGGSLEKKLTGTALSVVDQTPQANRDFVVRDLSKAADEQIIAEGQSDANGSFLVKIIGDATNLIIAFPESNGEPRTSGLASFLEGATVEKDLNSATDIACVAGAQALADESIISKDLTAQRIANLEAGAQEVLESQSVDFRDSASVQAAVNQVRANTNDGAHAPSQDH